MPGIIITRGLRVVLILAFFLYKIIKKAIVITDIRKVTNVPFESPRMIKVYSNRLVIK